MSPRSPGRRGDILNRKFSMSGTLGNREVPVSQTRVNHGFESYEKMSGAQDTRELQIASVPYTG